MDEFSSGHNWVSLFSGGKDSSYALYLALQHDLNVERILTILPTEESYMYHVPAIDLAELAAESIGIEYQPIDTTDLSLSGDSTVQGDTEIQPLETALRELTTESPDIKGVIAGAVESEFQANRIESMCSRLNFELFSPLWQRDPYALATDMIDAGFDIRIVQVAAAGLDQSWLGRQLDQDTLQDLKALNEKYGVHPLGEGGEFETIVVDGPHMSKRIELEYEKKWENMRGELVITDATLTER